MTLLLARRDVAELLTLDDCIEAVEGAFRLLGEGRVPPPAVAGMHAEGGGFHIKAALAGDRFVTKINANFFHAVPRIKGVVVLFDAKDGAVLSVVDSIDITILRTGAATAVAAKYLARPGARTALVCGCGNQGRVQARALARVRPIEKVYALDSKNPPSANAMIGQPRATVSTTMIARQSAFTTNAHPARPRRVITPESTGCGE